MVTATDACGTPTVTFVSDAANTVGCTETTTRTYRAIDACGNTAVCTQTIIRTVDVTPPVITCPATLNLFVMHRYLLRILLRLLQRMPVVLQRSTFVSDAANTVGCTETTTRTYLRLMLVVILLHVLKLLQERWM